MTVVITPLAEWPYSAGRDSRENLDLIDGIHDWCNDNVIASNRVVAEHAVFEKCCSRSTLAVNIERAQTASAAAG